VRATTFGLILVAVFCAGPASAYDAEDPHNCNGVDWDDKRALVVAQVTAQPRVNFIKSPYDDDFKADACPAATDACRKKSYLVTGDLVLLGRTLGDFTCVTYQSPQARKQVWTAGWLPRGALAPVKPMASPRMTDWTGTWEQPGGSIEITRGTGGKLKIEGEMIVPGAQESHTGEIEAQVTAKDDTIAFVDDGTTPFDKIDEGSCRVRMQRIGPWLMVEDNDGCGGAGVTFTGLYKKK
jgi:hypothetical protein